METAFPGTAGGAGGASEEPVPLPTGRVWGHCSKRGRDKIGVQGSSHGNSLCCSSSVAPLIKGVNQEISGHTEREGQRGLLEVLCLCPPGKRVLMLGEVLGPDLITPCVALRMQPQL